MASTNQTADFQKAFQLALSYYGSRRLTDAEAICHQIVVMDPNHFGALHLLGALAIRTAKPERAVELINRALQQVPSSASAHCNLGEAYRALRRLDEAVASYQKAITLSPDLVEGHYNLGNVFCDQGKMEEGLHCYQNALSLKPDLTQARSNLAQAYMKLGNHALGLETLLKATGFIRFTFKSKIKLLL